MQGGGGEYKIITPNRVLKRIRSPGAVRMEGRSRDGTDREVELLCSHS